MSNVFVPADGLVKPGAFACVVDMTKPISELIAAVKAAHKASDVASAECRAAYHTHSAALEKQTAALQDFNAAKKALWSAIEAAIRSDAPDAESNIAGEDTC